MNLEPKILVLEDHPDIAHQIQSQLLKFGYTITAIASSYEEALVSVKQKAPDLAICDIKIRGYKDGIQAAQDIRKILDIPIIFLTAFLNQELRDRAFLSTPASYLLKPINYDQLHIAIQLALQNHQAPEVSSSITQDGRYFVWSEGIYDVIHVEDILFLRADNVATQLYTRQKAYHLASKTLKKAMEELIHPDIMRVSRSEAIHLKHIKQFDRKFTFVVMQTDSLPNREKINNVVYITASYREEFKRRLGIKT